MRELKIGNKIGTKKFTLIIDKNIHTCIAPLVEVNGEMMAIQDQNTKSGLIECNSRHEARKRAKEAQKKLVEINSKFTDENGN